MLHDRPAVEHFPFRVGWARNLLRVSSRKKSLCLNGCLSAHSARSITVKVIN